MAAYLEVWRTSGPEALALDQRQISIGKSRSNDLVIAGDPTVSRMHAALEPVATGWIIRDLGSRNGTLVNGERVMGQRALHPGDEIRVGGTRLVFRAPRSVAETTITSAALPAPDLTRRERDVLIELCRPLIYGDLFTEPASVKQIAAALFLTEVTVKQHLLRLYLKFSLGEDVARRRVRLANDAIHRGAVTVGDLRPVEPEPQA